MNRRPVPFELGPVHFIGIGGIGMSGIAEIMLRIGYTVQGSDAKASANTERLEKLGAKIFIGHAAEHVDGASAVVYSTAVKADNPEMVAGRNARLLSDVGAAAVATEDEITVDSLAGALNALLKSPEQLAKMAAAASSVATPDAAERLADLVERTAFR